MPKSKRDFELDPLVVKDTTAKTGCIVVRWRSVFVGKT